MLFLDRRRHRRHPDTPRLGARLRALWAGRLAPARDRTLRALAPLIDPRFLRASTPGLVPLAIFPFLAPVFGVEVKEPLFGDTLVFQYTGWCIRHGMRLYRDVGMADGPFVHYLHALMQVFGGRSDTGFRIVDLMVHGLGAGTIGALVAPRVDPPGGKQVVQRAVWAGVAGAFWLCWYMTLNWTITTEREVYYTLFGCIGLAALYASGTFSPRAGRIAACAGGVLVASQLFGKPTGIIYSLLGAAMFLVEEDELRATRAARLRMAAAGGLAVGLLVLLSLIVNRSFSYYWLWCFTIPYRGNMFLFRIDWLRLLFSSWEPYRMTAILSLVGGCTAVATGWLPRRALPLALLPPMLFVLACLQGRGYEYQVVPVTGTATLLIVVFLAKLWTGCTALRWPRERGAAAMVALVLASAYFFDGVQHGPFWWNGDRAVWDKAPHEFASVERKVGEYIKQHTRREDYVFVYSAGENAHVVLYTAERRTAAPFFHSFWLDPIGLLPQSHNQPTAQERKALQELQTRIRGMTCPVVEKRMPTVMAFNLLPQVFSVCPNIEKLLAVHYALATEIGGFKIYMRKNVDPS